ncbi:glutaminyl-tRNA synthetase [Buchnera aphidicola str. Bp (Baizongia pistaciae)]|uniref:Glutamine--tRNA ligase n=1 Tax=Buchnera aphidicola subsp. Baizongia pistaciae (strain Bp) TaxID=224915 RepID=SYQ_BUCBP|nr:glutamine--tRNA ligase [Buchnera aphidicola]Q89AD4.1 RecName: Full=Glutamine--tRNA ligase; AltName: Full=Glutaminyl-tRNA synthetase; Short=GlnRS [Buchnera aphidicola str. Bp (Baizongia pistaciae)]AAO27089.1 glutaminyl-tRNA synthetase [Buchnera aphidicola str. Bp (Baizongia pistaciae)]
MKKQHSKISNFIQKIISEDIQNKKITHVKTRFPPEPNGYLHLGHAKSICLNFDLAQEFKGTCNLRFDDTNPKNEDTCYINSIIQDIKWLEYKWHNKIRYASLYFNKIYQYAIKLIKKGLAYVDQLSPEEIRTFRGTLTTSGIDSPYRTQSIEKNLNLFKKMKQGKMLEGTACLRAKIDMASNCITMRDPVLYRIIFSKHHQTNKKWCIYPTYDFTHCISDALEKITHSLCTLEFQDHRKLYEWILKKIDISCNTHQYEFSRLKLEYSVLSKRKLNLLVNNKVVNGWDDPRMPTLSGLRNRGYTPSSIKLFCKKIGITKQENTIQLSFLESCIRSDLNPIAPRYMAVIHPIKIQICNLSDNYEEILNIPNHPTKPNMGCHKSIFSNTLYIDQNDFYENKSELLKKLAIGKEIRLRYSYVIKAHKIKKDQNNNIKTIFCTYDKNTLGKNPKNRKILGVIHWISEKNVLPARFFLYDKLFTIQSPETVKNFLQYINTNSLVIKYGFVEKDILTNISTTAYQFEREGYFCINKNFSITKNLTFNRIVTLKDKIK